MGRAVEKDRVISATDSGFPEVTLQCPVAIFPPAVTVEQDTMEAPWVVVGKRVVHRELGIVVKPTRDIYSSHRPRDPQDLCDALNRVYSASTPQSADAPAPPPDREPPSPA